MGVASAVLCLLIGANDAAAQRAGDAEADDDANLSASTDTDDRDAEARALFEAGVVAFEAARYADALDYYQRAYELSGRPELLYNIGTAADRLRRDRLALESFEGFLRAVPDHPRRREIEVRMAAIREALAAAESADAEHASTPVAGGISTGALVGGLSLGVAGVAGVVTAIVGLAAGGCTQADAAGMCVRERTPGWAGIATWGGLGLAAIVGAIVVLVTGRDGGAADGRVRFEGDSVRWSF